MADHEMAEDDAEIPTTADLGAVPAEQDYSMGGETTVLQHQGRLVVLRRDAQGGYAILMREQQIQGFCGQFEEITGWRMPRDTQLQARIAIQPAGRLRSARYPDHERIEDGPELPERVQRRLMPDGVNAIPTEGDGVALESIAHPSNAASWQVEAIRHLNMERDQLTHTIDMIESLRRR